jgi:L-ascorbate metabolism protein UlaG (beta-lactamase superfamily)
VPKIRYEGVSCFEIVNDDGTVILIDPCYTINPYSTKKAEDIEKADAIFISHGARDHIGDTIPIAKRTGAKIFGPRNIKIHCSLEGIPAEQLSVMVAGVEKSVNEIKVKTIETKHGSVYESNGHYLSDISVGYIFNLGSDLKILHLGDTAIFGDLKIYGEIYQPDVALIPIGKFPGAITELDPYEASYAANWLGVDLAIPMHWDMDEQNDFPNIFIEEVRDRAPNCKVKVMKPGEELEF